MRKYQSKILIIVFIGILITGFGVWRTVEAADSSIYVSPAQADKKIGDTFDISVKVSPSGQKVCLVEGKMSLTKLSCQKVTMGSGLSAQLSPSCNDLSFLIGIQGCTTQDKTLFTVTVKANSSGTAIANFSGVDIIGEGVSISSAFSNGIYTLTAPAPISVSVLEEETTSGPGEEIILEEEVILEEETISEEEVITEGHEEEILSEENKEETLEEEGVAPEGLLAAIGNIVTLGTDSFAIGLIVIIAVLAVASYGIYELIWKKRIKGNK